VGVSFFYHMNDDVLEVDSFSCECCQALLPLFLRREPEAGATVHVCFGERKRERVCGKGNQLGYEYKSFQIGILFARVHGHTTDEWKSGF